MCTRQRGGFVKYFWEAVHDTVLKDTVQQKGATSAHLLR